MTVEVAVGQVWRHKREAYRRVEVLEVREENARDGGRETAVYVRRNTSRRTQAIMERTLRRNYYLAVVDARVART